MRGPAFVNRKNDGLATRKAGNRFRSMPVTDLIPFVAEPVRLWRIAPVSTFGLFDPPKADFATLSVGAFPFVP